MIDEINKAIGTHGLWKQRLRTAIESGKSEYTLANTRVDNICEFGKWLYSISPEIKATESYKKIKDLHAKFHMEAANVLSLALQGKKEEANKSLVPGGTYFIASADLTKEMMNWKKTLS